MSEIKLSVASYSFHGRVEAGLTDVFDYLDLAKYRYRTDWADIWVGVLPTLEPAFLAKVRAALDEKGMRLANLCVDGPHLWMDTAEERQAHRLKMLEYLKAGAALGAETVRIDFGGTEGHTMPPEAFDYIVATYREYCAIAADAGMRVGPENHWGWDRVPEYLIRVRDAVDSPAYGHLYHFGNFYDDPELGAKYAIETAMHTHVPANQVKCAKRAIVSLMDAGYTGAISVEHHSGKLETARVEWQLGAVRAILAEIAGGDRDGDGYITEQY